MNLNVRSPHDLWALLAASQQPSIAPDRACGEQEAHLSASPRYRPRGPTARHWLSLGRNRQCVREMRTPWKRCQKLSLGSGKFRHHGHEINLRVWGACFRYATVKATSRSGLGRRFRFGVGLEQVWRIYFLRFGFVTKARPVGKMYETCGHVYDPPVLRPHLERRLQRL